MFLYIWMCYLSFIANVPAYLRIWLWAYFRKRLWVCVTHWIYDFLCVRIFAFITLSLCECVTFSSVSVIAPLWERESVFLLLIMWLSSILFVWQCDSVCLNFWLCDSVTPYHSYYWTVCFWYCDGVRFCLCISLCLTGWLSAFLNIWLCDTLYWQGHRLRIWRWDSVSLSIFSFDCINVLPFYFLSVEHCDSQCE